MTRKVSNVLYGGLLILIMLASILALPYYGTQDVDQFWIRWIHDAEVHGLINGYEVSTLDYPPLSVALLWLFAKSGSILGVGVHAGLKLGLFVFLHIAVQLFLGLTRDFRLAAVLAAGLLVNSVCLAYVDILFMPPLLLAFWCLSKRRAALGLFLFTLSCLIKYQPLIIAPFIVLYLWRERKLTIKVISLSAAPVVLCIMIYGAEFFVTLGRALNHLYLSAYAFNFNWIVTRMVELAGLDTPFSMQYGMLFLTQAVSVLSKVLFMVFYVYLLATASWRRFIDCLWAAAVSYVAYFMLCTGVHENHLVLAVPVMAYVAAHDSARIRDAFIVTLYSALNMIYIYGIDGAGGLLGLKWTRGWDVLISLAGFVWFVFLVSPYLKRRVPQESLPQSVEV